MKNLENPKWIIFLNSLPLLLLSFILYNDFTIMKSLLKEETSQLWMQFSFALVVLFLINLGFSIFYWIKKKKIKIIYALYSLVAYLTFMYLYFMNIDGILPFYIPNWMISGNLFMHVGTFIMPTLIHALIILILHFTSNIEKTNAVKNFLILLVIPIGAYTLSQIVFPILHRVNNENLTIHIIIILILIATLGFLFFLIRLAYILALKKGTTWKKYELLWKIPICILLPIFGLLINNGVFDKDLLFVNNAGFFGNFSSPWFYILAVCNGVLLCLPKFKNYGIEIILFTLKATLFTYTLYFFLVFLPYLPFSLLAVIIIGLGFLMLAPILLFVVHTTRLYSDFNSLRLKYSKSVLFVISFISVSIIPALITLTYLHDKTVISETLEYVYNPDFEKEYKIDRKSLENTLFTIKNSKKKNNEFLFGQNLPFLDTYFNWLVLDNLTLSDSKLTYIDNIFFGENKKTKSFINETNDDVKITKSKSNSVYDIQQNCWKSTIDLEISNFDSNFSEYATTIHIPDGCYISDYYLYVGDKKEYGLLAEKKAALWVFNNIRNENKDPGLLYYLNRNTMAFKVFPFTSNEVRKTGIEIIHKEPFLLKIDKETFLLGDSLNTPNKTIENDLFVSALAKKNLPKIYRKPYYHFIIDASKNATTKIDDYCTIIEAIIKKQPLEQKSKISIVTSYSKTFDYDSNWKETYMKSSFKTGFYLDKGIKNILFETYKKYDSDTYPIIITLTDHLDKAIVENNFSNYTTNYFESEIYYTISSDNKITTHSLVNKPLDTISAVNVIDIENKVSCLEYVNNGKTYYLNNSDELSILPNIPINIENTFKKDWETGLKMQSKYRYSVFHPKDYQKEWLSLIKSSFSSHIMNPYTSFMVVENEAQKAALISKQNKVLAGNKALDLDEETPQMSEPSLFLLLGLVLVFFIYKKNQ